MTPQETAVVEAARRLFTADPMNRPERVKMLRKAVQAYEDSAVATVMGDPLEARFVAALDAIGATRARAIFQRTGLTVEQLAAMEYVDVADIKQVGPLTESYWLATLAHLGLDIRWREARRMRNV